MTRTSPKPWKRHLKNFDPGTRVRPHPHGSVALRSTNNTTTNLSVRGPRSSHLSVSGNTFDTNRWPKCHSFTRPTSMGRYHPWQSILFCRVYWPSSVGWNYFHTRNENTPVASPPLISREHCKLYDDHLDPNPILAGLISGHFLRIRYRTRGIDTREQIMIKIDFERMGQPL